MLFNSIDFAIFLPIVFTIYWLLNKNLKLQNLFLVISSYVFYGWWDWRFLSLILFSTIVDYFIGLQIHKTQKKKRRKHLLLVSIFVNLGFLAVFKYYNFFIENFAQAFSFLGFDFGFSALSIVLPVGISFYTFQTLSYSIDIYRNKLKPTSDFVAFSAFVCFFPQLVAGPIERAKHLLPQFFVKRHFDYSLAVDGMRQMLWGFFKKMVIADNCAIYVNMIFENHLDYSASALVLGAIFFAFQIYGDFSGYSDIAIGLSRLFGIDIMQNFAYPYFSRDIAEFWRRWHISLSTWFRDYVYIPLGGSRGSILSKTRNVFIIFLVSGFWHGANWTFLAWGAINALYFIPLLLTNNNRRYIEAVFQKKKWLYAKEFFQIIITFTLTTLAWIFFRAESIQHALSYIQNIFSRTLFQIPNLPKAKILAVVFLIFFQLIIEWYGRKDKHSLQNLAINRPLLLRWGFYSFVLFLIGMFLVSDETPFIYFQF